MYSLNEDVNKIKYLFNYQRGRVISEQINDTVPSVIKKPLGCRKYSVGTDSFNLCKELNEKKYRAIIYPVVDKILNTQKKKWIDVMSENERQLIFDVLYRLKTEHPNKRWYWPPINGTNRTMSGTIDEFIENRLPYLSFVYDIDSGNKWSQVNKLDTNYSDSAVFITDIVDDSRTLSSSIIYNDLIRGNTSSLEHAVNTISNYPEFIYNKYLKDPVKYTENSIYNTHQGDEIENSVIILMMDNGFELVHKGTGGDPIDVLLGIDVIMEKDGQLYTVQCKKVWKIEFESKTILNPDTGAYKVSGNPYVSKQKNLDLVAYGDGKDSIIVAKKQREVIQRGTKFEYGDKLILPTPLGSSSVFYIDSDSVVIKSNNLL